MSKKKTSFSSFPYRDSLVGSVRSSDKSEKVTEKVPRPKKKLVSLEDKQDSRTETLQRLLDIAGAGWVAQNTATRGRGKSSGSSRGERFRCPEAEGHFAAPGECGAYYRCVHTRETRLECGPGLVWIQLSANTGHCDWEDEVGCSAKQSS